MLMSDKNPRSVRFHFPDVFINLYDKMNLKYHFNIMNAKFFGLKEIVAK